MTPARDETPEDLVVGVDIGGTTVEAVVTDPDERILGRARQATDVSNGAGILAGAVDAIRAAMDGHGGTGSHGAGSPIRAIGVGIPGQVDTDSGVVRLATNLNIDREGLPVGEALAEEFGVFTTVENDARAAAVAAFDLLGSDRPALGTLAYISVGTGISAGFIVDGRPHRGHDGLAGEIGHVTVEPAGPACRCGLRGCLEAVASGPAIAALWPKGSPRQAEHLFAAAAAGDPVARHIARRVSGDLALAIQWIAAGFAPDVIALGGGVGSIGDPLLNQVRAHLAEWSDRSELARRMVPPDRVVAMPAGFPAGAVGAAALARRQLAGPVGPEGSVMATGESDRSTEEGGAS